MENHDESIAFRAKLERLLQEMCLPRYYYVLSRVSTIMISPIAYFILLWYCDPIIDMIRDGLSESHVWACYIVLYLVSMGFGFLVSCQLAKYFPPIQYLWGYEMERLKNIEKTRSQIFWIIVATGVGVFVTFFTR